MTPKQKAAQLRYLFSKELDLTSTDKKVINCALIAVEEVMVYLDQIMLPNPFKQYWNEVKHEIEKL